MKDTVKKIGSIIHTRFEIPHLSGLERVTKSLSPFEKLVLWVLVALLALSSLNLLSSLNNSVLVEVEARGGSFTEGIIGSPRFINPVLALSDADRDMVSLIYSGLLKATPEGGVIPDLAEGYTVTDDGLVYEFTIREDAVFHDGVSVTADDVIFTIQKTLDPTLKSAQRANWDGVIVEKMDERTVRFILARPYAPFLQNATIGVLPEHIWENIDVAQFPFSEINVSPIGSGPYKVKRISENASGIPERYVLEAFSDYTLGEPYIQKITLRFYPNEASVIRAYNKGDVASVNSVVPELLDSVHNKHVLQTPLPRIFGVFFNQNTAQVFSNIEVRKALDVAAPKQKIVNEVFAGYGTPIDSPIPPESIERPAALSSEEVLEKNFDGDIEEARAILSRNGWEFDEEEGVWESEDDGILRFSLATSNLPELKAVAETLKASWEELGAIVELKVFEAGNLNQNVIRPREYDALLFGEVIGRELDFFAFWHSSQRNDPGLNIALYANITVDDLLQRGRTLLDTEERDQVYIEFEEEVQKDIPAVFLYSPDFVYITPKNIEGVKLGSVTTSGDRFLNIHEWYIHTDHVWDMFAKN